jgi:hypothetical protein
MPVPNNQSRRVTASGVRTVMSYCCMPLTTFPSASYAATMSWDPRPPPLKIKFRVEISRNDRTVPLPRNRSETQEALSGCIWISKVLDMPLK